MTEVKGLIINEGPSPLDNTPVSGVKAVCIRALLPPQHDGQSRRTIRTYAPAVNMNFEDIASFIESAGFPAERQQTDAFMEDASWRDKDWDVTEDENGITAWHRRGEVVEIFEGITVKQVQTQLEPAVTPEPQPEPVGVAQPSSSTDDASRLEQLKRWIIEDPQKV